MEDDGISAESGESGSGATSEPAVFWLFMDVVIASSGVGMKGWLVIATTTEVDSAAGSNPAGRGPSLVAATAGTSVTVGIDSLVSNFSTWAGVGVALGRVVTTWDGTSVEVGDAPSISKVGVTSRTAVPGLVSVGMADLFTCASAGLLAPTAALSLGDGVTGGSERYISLTTSLATMLSSTADVAGISCLAAIAMGVTAAGGGAVGDGEMVANIEDSD